MISFHKFKNNLFYKKSLFYLMLGRIGTKYFHKNKKYSSTLAQTLSKFFFFKDLWKSLENQITKVGLCVK